MPRPLPPAVRDRIAALLHAGTPRNEIARQVGCSPGVVTKIAQALDVPCDRSQTKKATAAKRDYDQAERLALLNAGFDKARSLLEAITTPAHFQTWSVALATLIDKRRLEDGEVTSRTDVVTGSARELITRRLDELAARRGARQPAGETERRAVS